MKRNIFQYYKQYRTLNIKDLITKINNILFYKRNINTLKSI